MVEKKVTIPAPSKETETFLAKLSKEFKKDELAENLAYYAIGKEMRFHANQYRSYANRINEQALADAPLGAKLTRVITAPLAGAFQLSLTALNVAFGVVKGIAGVALLPFGNKTVIKSAARDFNAAVTTTQRGISSIVDGVLYPVKLAAQTIDGRPNKQDIKEQGKRLQTELGVPEKAWKYGNFRNYFHNLGHTPVSLKVTVVKDIIPKLQQHPEKIESHIKARYAEKKLPISQKDLEQMRDKVLAKVTQLDIQLRHYIKTAPNAGLSQLKDLQISFEKQRRGFLRTQISEKLDHANMNQTASKQKAETPKQQNVAKINPPAKADSLKPVGKHSSKIAEQRKDLEHKISAFI